MKVIAVSGKARHGKDTVAEMLRDVLEGDGHSVKVVHYADLLKFMCKTFFEWNGEKDDIGRQILQYVGTDVVRAKQPDFWVDFIKSVLGLFPDEWEYVIIADTRFPNEVDAMKRSFDTTHVRVFRTNFDSPLSPEQQAHPSETALDTYDYDYALINDGTVEDLRRHIIDLAVELTGGREVKFEEAIVCQTP